jgi:hypothetical protein
MPGLKRYDAFISYRHRDAEAVHRIARRLADDAGMELFVDAWNLVPGDRFTGPLADAVRASRCVAAFKGPEGMSEWVESETELAISQGVRVVPVLLPGATEELPAFLPLRTWVDLRHADDADGFHSLVAGIRGEAPGRPRHPEDSRRYHSLALAFVAREDGYWGEIRGSEIAPQALVRLELDPLAMREKFDLARRPTRTVLRKNSTTRVPDGAALAGVGTELYQLLARSGLGPSLEGGLRGVDRQAGEGVRLLIDTSRAPALAGLPWEFLTEPDSGASFSSSPFTPITRWFDLDGGLESLLLTRPLRLLVVSASPSGHPPVALARELAHLKDSLSEAALFELLDHATPETLRDALQDHRPNVLHFVGHGEMKEGGGAIVLESEDGTANPVSGRGLAVLLENHVPPLQLVFLNSCEGGATSPQDAFSSVAETLVKRHLPAVIAMQFPIPDDAAVTLARGFYRDLMAATPVDAALASARGVLYADTARFDGFEWGTPALYVRSPRARFGPFLAAAAAAAAPPIPAAAAAAPITPQPAGAPPTGVSIGGKFFADRWVAISAITAVTILVLSMAALRLIAPLGPGSSSANFPSTTSASGPSRPAPGEPAAAGQAPASGFPPELQGLAAVPSRPGSPSIPRAAAGAAGVEIPVGVAGEEEPPRPPLPPPYPAPETDLPRPAPSGSSGSPTAAPARAPLAFPAPSRGAIEAMLGAERHDGSSVSGTVAASFRFRDSSESLQPFVRVGAGAAARDDDSGWMSLDAGVDVGLGSGFVGGGGGVRTDFGDTRATVFVRGGLAITAIERLSDAQWVIEGRWIHRGNGARRDDYAVSTGIRIPLGR